VDAFPLLKKSSMCDVFSFVSGSAISRIRNQTDVLCVGSRDLDQSCVGTVVFAVCVSRLLTRMLRLLIDSDGRCQNYRAPQESPARLSYLFRCVQVSVFASTVESRDRQFLRPRALRQYL
jgi:hypothetical protein